MKPEPDLLVAALAYLTAGLRPIPCKPADKPPLVRWQTYQERAPTEEEVTAWWTRTPQANVALLTGDGLLVVDLDSPGAEELLAGSGVALPTDAPRVRTGTGEHVYLAMPEGTVRNRAAIVVGEAVEGEKRRQIDVRGDGGYVLAPPSIHPNGRRYAWTSPVRLPLRLPQASPRLLALLAAPVPSPPSGAAGSAGAGWLERALRGVGAGERNNTAAKLAGYFLTDGRMPTRAVLALLGDWATRCEPPLPDDEVREVVFSVARSEARKVKEKAEKARQALPEVRTLADVMERVLYQVENPLKGVTWPFPGVNRLLVGGILPGEYCLLGGLPASGKTTLALQLAKDAAVRQELRVLIMSNEMIAEALGRRMLSQEAAGELPASALRTGRVSMDTAALYAERLAELPILVSDKVRNVQQLDAIMQSMEPDTRPQLIMIDYVQLLEPPKGTQTGQEQVAAVSKSLKAFALRWSMPMVCLSALSRMQHEEPPRLSDLRGTGQLESDADAVVFVHRDKSDGKSLLLVEKNRNGATGTILLDFDPNAALFGERAWQPTDNDEAFADTRGVP